MTRPGDETATHECKTCHVKFNLDAGKVKESTKTEHENATSHELILVELKE